MVEVGGRPRRTPGPPTGPGSGGEVRAERTSGPPEPSDRWSLGCLRRTSSPAAIDVATSGSRSSVFKLARPARYASSRSSASTRSSYPRTCAVPAKETWWVWMSNRRPSRPATLGSSQVGHEPGHRLIERPLPLDGRTRSGHRGDVDVRDAATSDQGPGRWCGRPPGAPSHRHRPVVDLLPQPRQPIRSSIASASRLPDSAPMPTRPHNSATQTSATDGAPGPANPTGPSPGAAGSLGRPHRLRGIDHRHCTAARSRSTSARSTAARRPRANTNTPRASAGGRRSRSGPGDGFDGGGHSPSSRRH